MPMRRAQVMRSVELAVGATVEDAIRAAQILDSAPADFTPARAGRYLPDASCARSADVA